MSIDGARVIDLCNMKRRLRIVLFFASLSALLFLSSYTFQSNEILTNERNSISTVHTGNLEGNTNVAHKLNDYRSSYANCSLLFSGILLVPNSNFPHREKIPDEEYKIIASNCQSFKQDYVTQPVSEEEVTFPIAYSIVMFKDVEQFERLLRAIYRPQNLYCVRVDYRSDVTTIHDSVKAIANWFSNVFVAPNPVKVGWCYRTTITADLICMAELLKSTKWKYFINLTGQEWSLKTNWKLVRILKVFNGSNNIQGTVKK